MNRFALWTRRSLLVKPTNSFFATRLFCSDDSKSPPESDRLTDFFKKVDRAIHKSKADVTLGKDENLQQVGFTKSDVISEKEDALNSVTSQEVAKSRQMKRQFVPYTFNRLLTEMDVEKLKVVRKDLPNKSFAHLMRHSVFVHLGTFKDKLLIGVVIENVDNEDLYIDFGGKFHCMCKRPDDKMEYPRGCLVCVRLKDPEMANKFMINTKGISLNEADAILVGPYKGKLVGTSDASSSFRGEASSYCVSSHHWKLL